VSGPARRRPAAEERLLSVRTKREARMRAALRVALATAVSVAFCARASAHDFSAFECTGKDFIAAYIDAMNTSDKFENAGLKVVSISDPETVEATADQLTCRGVFKFGSGEEVNETFILKDDADGNLATGYKPAAK
jgi:hypothetical protein